jgi:hypothetical protein
MSETQNNTTERDMNTTDTVRVTRHDSGAWQVETLEDDQWQTHSVWGGSKHHAEKKADELRGARLDWGW